MKKLSQHRGFSILMALGVTAVLLIVVTGLSVMYAKEFKLSRLSYDEILAQASSEWMFEYGMLKIKNHEDGFEDAVDASIPDLDTEMFKLKTTRSDGLNVKYRIQSRSQNWKTSIDENGFLVIPLFVAQSDLLSNESMNPLKNDNTQSVSGISVKSESGDLTDTVFWTLVASNQGESVALQWKWALSHTSQGVIDLMAYRCSYVDSADTLQNFESDVPCHKHDLHGQLFQNAEIQEELSYSYSIKNVSVADFLENNGDAKDFIFPTDEGRNTATTSLERKNPYLILYNNSGVPLQGVTVESSEEFTLPEYTLTATATKGDASQIFEFSENKGAVYDLLKYGYFDPDFTASAPTS